jgi:group I intron endonuclease
VVVYTITNAVNGKIYVGKTVDPIRRWKKHKRWARSKNPSKGMILYAAMKKYGLSSFKFEVVSENMADEAASAMERELIVRFNTRSTQHGYNVTPGGEGNRLSPSAETRAKISAKLKGRSLSAQTRLRVISALKKRDPTIYAKLGEARKGKPRPVHVQEVMRRNNAVGTAVMKARGEQTRTQVLELRSKGLSKREIADCLQLSMVTVYAYTRQPKALAFQNN